MSSEQKVSPTLEFGDEVKQSGSITTTGCAGEECTIFPASTIEVGKCIKTATGHSVHRYSTHYSCSCPAWRCNSSTNVRQRTCRHLSELLGEEYERVRTSISAQLPEVRTPTKRPSEWCQSDWSSSPSPSKCKRSIPSTHSSPKSPSRRHGSVLLANTWSSNASSSQDPSGWWVSEKLDGVRAWWDGEHLWSRRGQIWDAPAWFTDVLPCDMTLDGELWIDRDLFDYTSGICRTTNSKEWHRVKYMVFDAPDFAMEPVEERWRRIRAIFPTAPFACASLRDGTHVFMVEQVKCENATHFQSLVDKVLSIGGEGVMLRAPYSMYERRRSLTLYKWKPIYDADARVVGYEEGQNNAAGLVGSLICVPLGEDGEDKSIKRFRVGSGLTQAMRHRPPPIGTIIRYQYGGLSCQGVPRFPRYVGIRAD